MEWKAFLHHWVSGFHTNCRVRVVFENCISSSFMKGLANWHWHYTRRLVKSEGQKQFADHLWRNPAAWSFKRQIHWYERAVVRTNWKQFSKQLTIKALQFNKPNWARFWKDEHQQELLQGDEGKGLNHFLPHLTTLQFLNSTWHGASKSLWYFLCNK